MKLSYLLVGSALLACVGVVQASVIPVGNGSFETVGVSIGVGGGGEAWYSLPASAPGVWEYTGTTDAWTQYQVGTSDGAHFTAAADGTRILNLIKFGTLTQTFSTVNAGDAFTLEFDVAKGLLGGSGGAGTLTASILVGGTPIATGATFATTVAAGAWDHKTLTGTATSTGALSISFAPGTNSPWLDNVTMTVVPEPASLGLLSLAGLAMLRRRRA